MRITVTGAAGKLGSEVWKQLLERGHEVIATDIRMDPSLPGKPHIADMLNREACYQLFDNTEVLVHLSNHTSSNSADAQRVYADNCAMNVNVFQAAFESGVRSIIFASSIQVYGQGTEDKVPYYLPMDSDLPLRPQNTYAESKIAAESMLRYYISQGLASATAIRFPMLLNEHWRFRRFGNWSRWGKPGDGFTFLECKDGARLVALAAEKSLPGFRARFVANATPINQRPVQELIDEAFNGVPLKRSREEITSIVDQDTLREEYGWESSPHPNADAERHEG